MPYVPSKKTDGKSTDREVLDAAVEISAQKAAAEFTTNLSILEIYMRLFASTAANVRDLLHGQPASYEEGAALARAIHETGARYDYEGAYLGELNYAITRFIQRVPQILVREGKWKQELRYWYNARIFEALYQAAHAAAKYPCGIAGVFLDIALEYKVRVNSAYEAAQIVKSGDCYDAPYYTRLVEVVDGRGKRIGFQHIMLERTPETVGVDVLPMKVVLQRRAVPRTKSAAKKIRASRRA